MRRIAAFCLWMIGALASGGLLFGLIITVSRVERIAWLAFALAVGVALIMKLWPRMEAFQRWLISIFYVLMYLTYQVGPWLHGSDRIGVNSQVKRLVDAFDRHFYTAQLAAMSLAAGLLLIQGFRDRKRPWFSVWLLLTLACGLIVIQYSGSKGAPGTFGVRLAQWLHISVEAAQFILIAVRKTIHFSFYGLFAVFAVKAAASAGAKRPVDIYSGLAFVLLHAVFDESRQAFSPGRSASFWDICLDCAGMAFFVYLLHRNSVKPSHANINQS